MNICIVNIGFQMGGAERVITELSNLLEKSHRVNLIDFSGHNNFFYAVNASINTNFYMPQKTLKRKIISNIHKIKNRITRKSIDPIHMFQEQVDAFERILKNNAFDIVIFCQGHLTSLIPYYKSKFPMLKMIAWQHNNYDIYATKYHKDVLKAYFEGIKQSDCVVCLTKSDEKLFKKINTNSVCIYNPLTIEKPIISNVKQKIIIFVGRLVIEQKGLDLLIELAKRIDNEWRIYVAGDGVDREKFERKLTDSSLNKKVIMKGNLNSDELRTFYAEGAIFISTSRWEGFGLVITEAMASGLPIISFNNAGPSEILDNGKYGLLVDKYNLNEFAKKLAVLTGDLSVREYWKNQSLKRAKDFSRTNIQEQWERQIKELW